jgi:hypothetical protein
LRRSSRDSDRAEGHPRRGVITTLLDLAICYAERGFKGRRPMPTIYISDSGDDKNDGLSLKTAIYSLKQAQKLQGGKNDHSWHFGPRAWQRIKKELEDKNKKA